MPEKRRLPNWLKALQNYVEDTESPRHFWLWSGIFTICCALQRKVWLPYGIQAIYPNLYLLIVAPPGGRKAGPVTLAKNILQEVGHYTSPDGLSKRKLTQTLADISTRAHFALKVKGVIEQCPQAPLAVISKELSSLLAIDPKAMIEILTELFDAHDKWEYETSGAGEDHIRGTCVSCMLASTPTYLAGNLPPESIGGGFTSRCVIVYGDQLYKEVPIPDELDPILYDNLCRDLGKISMLSGELKWGKGTRDYFSDWYSTIKNKKEKIKDIRLHSFMARIHVIVLKVSIAIRVAYSDDLELIVDDMGKAITIVEDTLEGASEALGGHGRSITALDVQTVMSQIRVAKKIYFKEILQMNYRNTSKTELEGVLETITAMGVVKSAYDEKGEQYFTWKGIKE